MSGEVKLGEADYTVFWERLLFMSNLAIMNKSGTYTDYHV